MEGIVIVTIAIDIDSLDNYDLSYCWETPQKLWRFVWLQISSAFHLLTIVDGPLTWQLREPKVSDFESVNVLVMAD